jgi:hypothetical protein
MTQATATRDAQSLLDTLIAHFGVTPSNKDGGYILPNGTLLNLKRSNLSSKQYHHEVAKLLPEEMRGHCDEITIINLMIATGIVRYEAKGRVHAATLPTMAQRRKLFEIMKYSENDYLMYVSAPNAATIGETRLKSPQAHELLQFFEGCFSAKQRQYRADEFSVSQDGDELRLTFRPAQQLVASYDPASQKMTTAQGFEDVIELFKQLIEPDKSSV